MIVATHARPSAGGRTLFELAAADPAVRFSPHCWKTRMSLAHKGLDADCVPWRFTDKAEIAFSGQGFVPVLVDGDDIVSDSWSIAVHLEERYPDRPSLFLGPAGMALSRFVNAWSDGVLLGAVARVVLVDIHRNLAVKDKDYFRTTREKRFGAALEAVSADTPARLTDLRAALAPARAVLGMQAFLCGASPGYADYCVFGMFMWARCISGIELLTPDDSLVSWRERLLDAFDGLARRAAVAVL